MPTSPHLPKFAEGSSIDAGIARRADSQAMKRTPLLIVLTILTTTPDTLAGDAQDDLLYILQPESFSTQQLTDAPFHWLILEPTRDGRSTGDFTSIEVEQIRSDGACAKKVLAYLSIGEAEIYRDYWNPGWVNARGRPIPGVAPAWLGPENPDWEGNYKVRYWDEDWQALMLGDDTDPDRTPLDRIIDQGFDGVYLDIVDAFEYWSSRQGGRVLTRQQAREFMVQFVVSIADYARITRGAADFLVFPQNASDIIRNDDGEVDVLGLQYLDAISGIGQEDLFFRATRRNRPAETGYLLDQLRVYVEQGKTVLVTDYIIKAQRPIPRGNDARLQEFYTRCRGEGFVPYAAMSDRNLDEIVTLPTPLWSVAQPDPGCVE